MGLAFDPLTERETVEAVLDAAAAGRGGWICPTNTDVLRQYVASGEVRDLIERADLVVADGMPLVWASRIAARPLPERVAGSSLIWSLPARAAERGLSLYLLGGNPGAADAAAATLTDRYPDLRMAGTACPPFGFERDEEQLAEIGRNLVAARPDVVFVGLGFPKQERLIQRLRTALPGAYYVSCGISFSFVSGEVARAPTWAQRAGLEWLHRLVQEPRRLVRRYIVDGLPFVARLLASAVLTRLRGSVPAPLRPGR
jgi:N-acetylglucosaminyldiphosphoundecaprenol N-acetyl-beta-D-mannosaminyltransferase